MSDGLLTLETDGDVATLFLDSPPKNEMAGSFFHELGQLVRDVLPSLDTRGLVVRGRGRHFSSGADVQELTRVPPEEFPRNAEVFMALENLPYPVVAAVDGACFGSGLELALACRFRVAAPGALMGLPETGFGLMPGCGGTIRLLERVGLGLAMDLVLTGRFLTADEALDLGLVDSVVPRKELDGAARRLAMGLHGSPQGEET